MLRKKVPSYSRTEEMFVRWSFIPDRHGLSSKGENIDRRFGVLPILPEQIKIKKLSLLGSYANSRTGTTAEKGANKMSEERELSLFEIMDELDIDMDTAELILQDKEEEYERED